MVKPIIKMLKVLRDNKEMLHIVMESCSHSTVPYFNSLETNKLFSNFLMKVCTEVHFGVEWENFKFLENVFIHYQDIEFEFFF